MQILVAKNVSAKSMFIMRKKMKNAVKVLRFIYLAALQLFSRRRNKMTKLPSYDILF